MKSYIVQRHIDFYGRSDFIAKSPTAGYSRLYVDAFANWQQELSSINYFTDGKQIIFKGLIITARLVGGVGWCYTDTCVHIRIAVSVTASPVFFIIIIIQRTVIYI